MTFGEKLYGMRREKGLSQEQLADLLHVTRQSVSKWESGGAMPELDKLIVISDTFGVSVDYLVRDGAYREAQGKTVVTTADNVAVMEQLHAINSYIKKRDCYEYKSKAALFGLPLVHVKLSKAGKLAVAKGVIAIGNVAFGIISIGGICGGLISLGGISLGLFAIGGLAVGGLAGGGVAMGLFAIGGVALGIHAVGGVAVARELAVGGVASGRVGVGQGVQAQHALQTGNAISDAPAIRQFILSHYPGFWKELLWLIAP